MSTSRTSSPISAAKREPKVEIEADDGPPEPTVADHIRAAKAALRPAEFHAHEHLDAALALLES